MGSLQTSEVETVEGAEAKGQGRGNVAKTKGPLSSPSRGGGRGRGMTATGRGRGGNTLNAHSSSPPPSGGPSMGKKFATSAGGGGDGGENNNGPTRTEESDQRLALIVLSALYGVNAPQMLSNIDCKAFVTELEKELHKRLLSCNVTTKRESWSVSVPCHFTVPIVVETTLNEKLYMALVENYIKQAFPAGSRRTLADSAEPFLIHLSKLILDQSSDQCLFYVRRVKSFDASKFDILKRVKMESLKVLKSMAPLEGHRQTNLAPSGNPSIKKPFQDESNYMFYNYVLPSSFHNTNVSITLEDTLYKNVTAQSPVKNAEGQEYLGYETFGEGGVGFGFYDVLSGNAPNREKKMGTVEEEEEKIKKTKKKKKKKKKKRKTKKSSELASIKLVLLDVKRSLLQYKPKHLQIRQSQLKKCRGNPIPKWWKNRSKRSWLILRITFWT